MSKMSTRNIHGGMMLSLAFISLFIASEFGAIGGIIYLIILTIILNWITK